MEGRSPGNSIRSEKIPGWVSDTLGSDPSSATCELYDLEHVT